MTALPPSSDFTGSTITEAQAKAFVAALRDFLSGMFGADGEKATALATLGAVLAGYAAKITTTALTAADRGKLIDATTGTWTMTMPTVAATGAGWSVVIRNSGSGVITLARPDAATFDGATTLALPAGRDAIVTCTGTNWAVCQSTVTAATAVLDGLLTASAQTIGGSKTFSAAALFAGGNAALPSIAFAAEPTMGMYRLGAGIIGWGVSGVYNMSRGASTLVLKGVSTETQGLEIGFGRSGDGFSFVDLIGDATYTDYGARLQRSGGANAATSLFHRGLGNLDVNAQDAANVRVLSNGVELARFVTGGGVGIGNVAPTTALHVNGPIRCASYTVGTVPAASTVGAGTIIFVSNESGGAIHAGSDGTNWLRFSDRAIIS